jgi:hypothetical protein
VHGWKYQRTFVVNENNASRTITFDVPVLTADLIDKVQVFAYVKVTDDSQSATLPYITRYGDTGTYNNIVNIITGKILYVQQWVTAGAAPATWLNRPSSFYTKLRYIIIPGSVLAARQVPVDYSNYEAVKKHYNLPD